MVLIFFILLFLYSDLKFLSLCFISKMVLPLYDIVVFEEVKTVVYVFFFFKCHIGVICVIG